MNDRELMLMALEELEEHADVGYGSKTVLQALRDRLAQLKFVVPEFKFPDTYVNLDNFNGFTFNDSPKGVFVGEIEMLKWLVRNRSKTYFRSNFYKEKCERTKYE
jgi:hypothetical protein